MYNNKKIFILGMARSGYEVAKLLSKHNAEILITDKTEQIEEHIKELSELGINLIISEKPEELLNETYDYVVKNPGIKVEHKVCIKASKLNIPIINEVEVAFHYLPEGVKIIGVTGANGKTTTTTLIYEILKKANLNVKIGGNIGYPLSSLINQLKENDILVIELSAQQLHDFVDFKTNIAVLTNLTEVHLDHFKTYENYQRCKKKIFNHHTNNDIAIINGNDIDSINLTSDIDSKKVFFKTDSKSDIFIKENKIIYENEKVIDIDDIKLKGIHNYQNIMCAILACKRFNVSNETIIDVLSNFSGVEHRLEFVKKVNERIFYNDSKATNVKATQTALNSFNTPIILLLGGMDRQHSFDELIDYINNVKCIVCYGETKNRIFAFCHKNNIPCFICETLTESVNKAYEYSKEKDTILLSPACASWDQYEKFEDRGDDFKRAVNLLK